MTAVVRKKVPLPEAEAFAPLKMISVVISEFMLNLVDSLGHEGINGPGQVLPANIIAKNTYRWNSRGSAQSVPPSDIP